MTNDEKILAACSNGPRSLAEISDEAGINTNAANTRLHYLLKAGKVSRIGTRCKYRYSVSSGEAPSQAPAEQGGEGGQGGADAVAEAA